VDTSDQYIEMCSKADELVDFIPLPSGQDFYSDNGRYWLPRQDQLQDMIDLVKPMHTRDGMYLLDREGCLITHDREHLHWVMNDFVDNGIHDFTGEMTDYAKQFTSMEQLWLACVMKENYNKEWNGEDWVIIK